jgi:SH3-like domain-containing protein
MEARTAMRGRLTIDYTVQYADPINVSDGDPVTVVRPDEQFTRWRWCVAADGREGWVPETALSTTEAGPARMTAPYEATELSARRGDIVEILREFDGFLWARSADGRLGWLPEAAIERLDDDDEGLRG